MRLYIDKDNILAFIAAGKSDYYLFFQSICLIKKGMEVYYNFSKEEILKHEALKVWFNEMLATGVKFDSVFCSDESQIKPPRPLKSNFYVSYDSDDRSSIYLLNMEENMRDTLLQKRSILIGCPGDEMGLFNSLLAMDDKGGMMCQLKSWKDYCPDIPLTDIIICDNHYFKDINVYNKNDNELIRALAEIPKDSLNLVIFTKPSEVDRKIVLEDECKKIKEMVCRISGLSKSKCAVTIVTTYRLHSRHIITNYYRIVPTSCIHLKDSGLKEDVDIDLKPHSHYDALEQTKSLIHTCQSAALNPVNIYGDKKSNYINFNK